MKRDISRAITALVFCPSKIAKLIIEMCKQRNNSVREIALQCLADCGCIEAMYKVALVYKKNDDKTMFINYIKTYADADFMPTQYEYGVTLFTGYGCDVNISEATNRITRAADN